MNFIDDLKKRKIINNITNEKKLNSIKNNSGVYIGFDPSGASLHLGNFIQIITLLRFQKAGFKPYAILGGATGMIGDPSGKKSERKLKTLEEIKKNKIQIGAQLKHYGLTVIDNYDHYKNMSAIEFLRDIGKLLNINYMIQKDIVKSRVETGISFTEFSYQLIQGWDFKKLYEDHNVHIQVGGSDQWGNITAGIEIIRKEIGDENTAVGITTELLLNSSGVKFGKSEYGALYIDKELTSPYTIYQYLLNTSDSNLEAYTKWMLLDKIEDIDKLLMKHRENPKNKIAQKYLAYEVVKMIHGKDESEKSLELTNILFKNRNTLSLREEHINELKTAIPTFLFESNTKVIDLLTEFGIAQSKREAREFINAGAITINDKIISKEDETIDVDKRLGHKAIIIKKGKRNFYLAIKK